MTSQEHQHVAEQLRGHCGSRWRSRSVDARRARKLPSDSKLWTSRPEVKLRGLPDSQRQRDYLDVLFGSAVVQNPGVDAASLAKNLWGDPSQNVDRIPKKHKKGVGTLTTSTALYSFECDAVLSGAAGIQLMGWHRGAAPMEQVSESTARNLAGDSFSVPLAALMQCALFWNPHTPWWS